MGSETEHPCLLPPKDPKDFLLRRWVAERTPLGVRTQPADKQALREAMRNERGGRLRCADAPHGETLGPCSLMLLPLVEPLQNAN